MFGSTLSSSCRTAAHAAASAATVVAVTGMLCTPTALAKPAHSKTRSAHALSKHHAGGRSAKAARSAAGSSGPLLHTVGTSYSDAPYGDGAPVEAWIDFGDQVRSHHIFTNPVYRDLSVEEWNSDIGHVGVALNGDPSASIALRFDLTTDVVCVDPPQGPGGQWTWQAASPKLQAMRALDRQQIQIVDAISHDASARAGLPAGPAVNGHATVSATIPAVSSPSTPYIALSRQYMYDQATGAVVRDYDPSGNAYTNYTAWDLQPAGTNDAPVTIPPQLTNSAHCG